MKKYFLIVLVVIVAIILIVLVFSKKDNFTLSDTQNASLRFSWIPSASFAGDIAGLTKFDQKYNLNLNAEFGGPGINPIQMVAGGQNTFGWAGADEVLIANEKGADLVIIGLIHYHPPVGYVSSIEKNINTPESLIGKKVGILPFGNSTMIYEIMLNKNNIDRKKVTEITISNDMKPFLNGAYDVHPIYVYDEAVELDKEGFQYNIIKPEDFGVNSIKGYVYFTKRETLEKNPDLVKAFVYTMADGWNYAVKNPDDAIVMLKEFAPDIDPARERQVLDRGMPYFTAYKKQPINSDFDSWNSMVAELKNLGLLKNDVDLSKVLQLSFINSYYK